MLRTWKGADEDRLRDDETDSGYLGVKRNFSSRSQRRDAESSMFVMWSMGTLWVLDSYLFTGIKSKSSFSKTVSCRFPQAGSRELQYHGEFTCFSLLCSRESWPLFRDTVHHLPTMSAMCFVKVFYPYSFISSDFTRDLIIKHISRTGENLIPWPWFSCWI